MGSYAHAVEYLRASSSSMEISKPDTIIRKTVDVGRTNLTAKAADVREAQVVGDDDEEVWTGHG